MKLYFLIVKTEIQKVLEYKWAFFLKSFATLGLTLGFVFLWRYLYSHGIKQTRFSQGDIIAYYVISGALMGLTEPRVAKILRTQIRSGQFSNMLIRPVNVVKYLLAQSIGEQIARVAILFIFHFVVLVILMHMGLVNLSYVGIGKFLIYFPLILLITFSFYFTVGVISFWSVENMGVVLTIRNSGHLLSGRWLPISFLPIPLQFLLKFLPFKYVLYEPTMIMLNFYSWADVMRISAYALLQIIIWLSLGIIVFQKGVKRYDAVGN